MRFRPQLLALCALMTLTAAVVGLSRLILPRRLAPIAALPAAIEGFTQQTGGYVRVPADAAYSVTVFFAGNVRLFIDGVPAGTFTPSDNPRTMVPIGSGVHRVHLQFSLPGDGTRPPELVWSSGRQPQVVPPEALSPRSMSAQAWRARDFLTPLTIGLVWLWFAAAVWLVARPFLAWLQGQLSEDEVRPVQALLALSLLLAGYGMSWGLPGGWAQDEIGGTDITNGLSQWFVGGWHHRYPPLHFYLLALVHLPMIAADRLDMIDMWSTVSQGELARMSRAVSVALSVATAALVHVVARTVVSNRAAVMASLCWILVLTGAFYGKLANLDMPYTFWFALSLVGYVRALTRNAPRDFILFAAAAAAAVCTKDQAYGLYVLPTLYLVAHRVRTIAAQSGTSAIAAVLRDRALPAAAATGLLTFAALYALPFNWQGFQRHVALLTGRGPELYRMVESASASGHVFLFRRTLDHLAWSMGWPVSLIALAGVLYSVARRKPSAAVLALLLPVLSYYSTLIVLVGYSYDRFMLPVCLVLSIFAGRALDAAWPPGAPRWRTAVVAAMLVYTAVRTTSINVMMAADGRYFVEAWIHANVPPGTRIGVFEHENVVPRLPVSAIMPLLRPLTDLPVHRPEYLVLTDNYLTRVGDGAPERGLYSRLLAGTEGYDVVLQHQTSMPFAILAFESRFRHPDGSFTTLHKVNPLVTVLHRRDVP